MNAHPPSSVLLAFPFASLDFPTAFFAWNILSLFALAVSLWLLARGLNIPISGPAVLAVATTLLLSNPLIEQLRQGQLNLILLALLTGTGPPIARTEGGLLESSSEFPRRSSSSRRS